MINTDSELHMLAYWIEDKGIETAFSEYYPNLARKDTRLRLALAGLRNAKVALGDRVSEIVNEAENAREAGDA